MAPSSNQLRAASNAVKSLRPHRLSSSPSPLSPTNNITTSTQQVQHKHTICCLPVYQPNHQTTKLFSTTKSSKMASSMPATGGHSAACCNIPPVASSGYQKKGDYQTVDNRKTYATGPLSEASKGIVVIMDIFGFYDQTVQGCDILATSDDHRKYAVFMPDAFDGEPLPLELFPPTDDDKKAKVGAFFGKNSPPSFVPKTLSFVKAASEKYPNIKEWGVVGFCWGSKVISLTANNPENPFKIAAQCHPAMVDPKDAENIDIPIALLASKDEPADDVKAFEAALTKAPAKHVEIFGDQIHGWMAARSDLKDERVKEEYVRGYKTVLTFFANNWP